MYGVLPMKLMYDTGQPKNNRISFKLKYGIDKIISHKKTIEYVVKQ